MIGHPDLDRYVASLPLEQRPPWAGDCLGVFDTYITMWDGCLWGEV